MTLPKTETTRRKLRAKHLKMLKRCALGGLTTPSGRPVKVCDRWRADLAAFIEDVGAPPDDGFGYWLCRRDHEGDYEPSNVYWARAQDRSRAGKAAKLSDEQVRDFLFLVHDQDEIPRDIAPLFGIKPSTARNLAMGRAHRLEDYPYPKHPPKHWSAKSRKGRTPVIPIKTVRDILDLVHVHRHIPSAVAKRYGVSPSWVEKVARGELRRLPDYPYPAPRRPPPGAGKFPPLPPFPRAKRALRVPRGERRPDAMVLDILRMIHIERRPYQEVADHFGVSRPWVYQVASGARRNVPGFSYPKKMPDLRSRKSPLPLPPAAVPKPYVPCGLPGDVLDAIRSEAGGGTPFTRSEMLEFMSDAMPPPAEGRRDTRRQQVARAVRTLIGAGLVVETDGVIRAVDEMC